MPTVIPVKFTYAARDLWFNVCDSQALEGDHVICSTERGTEIGLATAMPREVSAEELKRMVGNATLKPVLRVASDQDLERAEELAQKGEEALPVFRHLVGQSDLDMKPVGVEYVFGGEKVVCYFAAEERVDFRQLVRDLSHELHERIDMRQIGVREEAAVVGGFGHCGQELCCARFGLSFEPVSIRMAKEQDLPLTSNKISGACGRLMCCLRYEFEAYRDFKGRAPKRNAVIDTPLGKAKIVEYDTPKEQICLRIENGKMVRIPLAEMIASPEAVKKSEELHCPCRPDTVVRESLEKLNSPDVQMALAELDRKSGVVAPEDFNEDDLFVETRTRRRRTRASGQEEVPSEGEAAAKPAGESTRRSRRRRKKSPANAETPARKAAPAQEAPAGDKPSRRRRRKRTGAPAPERQQAQAQEQSQAKAPQPKETRRRRHHRAEENADGQQQAQQTRAQRQQQKPKRRPGDRGGAAGTTAGAAASAAPAGNASGEAPKRRRRRRGGRGRSNKGGSDQQAPSSTK